MQIDLEQVRNALRLDPFDEAFARERMAARPRPRRPVRPYRDGAVLVLLYPAREGLTIPLTRRTETVEHHRGQISFPGGAREEGESLLETALREASEEVGIRPASVEVLGELPVLEIPPSGFRVRPFVGHTPTRPAFRPDPAEVAEVIEIPVCELLDPARRAEEERRFGDVPVRVPFYDVPGIGEPRLWGATAMMLSGFLERLRVVLG